MTVPKLYELVADKVHLILATTLWILFLSASWVQGHTHTVPGLLEPKDW